MKTIGREWRVANLPEGGIVVHGAYSSSMMWIFVSPAMLIGVRRDDDEPSAQPLALDLDEAGVPETGLDRLRARPGRPRRPSEPARRRGRGRRSPRARPGRRGAPRRRCECSGTGPAGIPRPPGGTPGRAPVSVPGIDVPADDEDGCRRQRSRRPRRPAAPASSRCGLAAGHPGRHDEAVEGDDLGQDRVWLDRLADPGVDPERPCPRAAP